jgi:hypothetical protein
MEVTDMTKLKKTLVSSAMALAICAASLTAFAAVKYGSPAEAVAALTGKTVESVTALRQTGKTYGTIAKEAGKLTEFQDEMTVIKKDVLAQKVAAGTMTQAQADAIIAALEKNQETCDGTGSAKIGQKMGAGFGSMNGNGQGRGAGGPGRGQGAGGGSCLAQ